MILDDIITHKKLEVAQVKKNIPLRQIISVANRSSPAIDFISLHTRTSGIKIISEVKKASPSQGVIREDFNHLSIAREYEDAGAFAISVLTDGKFFGGDLSFLSDIRPHCGIPLLRKDFTVDIYQIYEARCHGADLVLLIAAVLSRVEIEEYIDLAHTLGMNCIVEVHNEKELETAVLCGSKIIGINNRDLRTFSVSLDVSKILAPMVPEGTVTISESGISSPDDMAELCACGVDTFLIGETFMKEKRPGAALRRFLN